MMQHIFFEFIPSLIQVNTLQELLNSYGNWFYAFILIVIFCETGLIFTPFLPGDSLLFTIGALVALNPESNIVFLLSVLVLAAVLGDAFNYATGFWVGPRIFRWEKSWFFNPAHLEKSNHFFTKHGPKTIILSRFVPILRTFAPFLAGASKMKYKTFAFNNLIGAVAWVLSCTLSGYFFGNLEYVKNHFELVIMGVVFVSILPVLVELLISARHAKR